VQFHFDGVCLQLFDDFDLSDGFDGRNPLQLVEFYVSVGVELALGVVHPHHGYREEPGLHLAPSVLLHDVAVVLVHVRLGNHQLLLKEGPPVVRHELLDEVRDDEVLYLFIVLALFSLALDRNLLTGLVAVPCLVVKLKDEGVGWVLLLLKELHVLEFEHLQVVHFEHSLLRVGVVDVV